MAKSIYLLGDVPIEDARLSTEKRLRIQLTRRSSSYWGGDYYECHLIGGSYLMIFCNQEDDAFAEAIVDGFSKGHILMSVFAEDCDVQRKDMDLIRTVMGDPQFHDELAAT